MKRKLLAILLVAISVGAWAQKKPLWVERTPIPDNNTYDYRVGYGTGHTIGEAKTNALKSVAGDAGYSITLPFISDNTDVKLLQQTYNIPINVVCNSCVTIIKKGPEKGKYQIYLLCKVAKKGNIAYDWGKPVNCSTLEQDSKPYIALINSMFIPGLGQIRKRGYGEGLLTLAGEVTLVGAGTFCYLTAQDKLDIMHSDGVNYADYSKAHDDYNRLRDASYVIWGAAAGLYVFNLIRAATMTTRPPKNCIAIQPTMLPENERVAPGLAVRVKF